MRSKVIGIIAAIVIGVAAVAGGIYVAMSLEKVGQGEVGVVYTMKNGVQEETLGPGWHFVGPFAKVKKLSGSAAAACVVK